MSASDGEIRLARPEDLPLVMTALAGLARDLGDPFNATDQMISAALFGPAAHSVALFSSDGETPRGIVLFSPFVSTVLGQSCIYVSDLWVAQAARGQSLGRYLLAAAAREGAARWQARALYLNVYNESLQSIAFYRHLGFEIRDTDKRASLTGDALEALTPAGALA